MNDGEGTRPRPGPTCDVGAMIARWERVAAEVAAGYGATLDDYLNDLDLRRLIGEAVRADPFVAPRVAGRLRAADARLRAATRQAPRAVWGAGAAPEWTAATTWWYFRVPLAPGPDLAADLRAAGLDG